MTGDLTRLDEVIKDRLQRLSGKVIMCVICGSNKCDRDSIKCNNCLGIEETVNHFNFSQWRHTE